MFSSLLDKMGASSRAPTNYEVTRAPSSDSLSTVITAEEASNASSTPPTSIGDNLSVASSIAKNKSTTNTMSAATEPSKASEPTPKRSQRARASVGTYNVKVLCGTAIHAPKKYSKNLDSESRRQTISGDTFPGALGSESQAVGSSGEGTKGAVSKGIDALDLSFSGNKLLKSENQTSVSHKQNNPVKKEDTSQRKSLRSTEEKVEGLTKKLGVLGKRSRKTLEDSLTKATRELRNLADTKEFAKIETEPVVLEVWSNGKYVPQETASKKKVEVDAPTSATTIDKEPDKKKSLAKAKKDKLWLGKGIYAGQSPNELDWFKASGNEKSAFNSSEKPRSILPLPLWQGQRLLHAGRDFKLPFDVCSPLPPGQPKPAGWLVTSSNRFIGEASTAWKKSKLFDSFYSKCICKPEIGCDEDCQNRIMLYECDDANCGAGRENCTNRAFAQLQTRRKGDQRRKGGNKFEIGVEVFKTADRGYGVRSNRCFDPQQIIVEYTGEIITEDECDRRMNEDYKNNECYYLMSFDQNMIIDATKGSIARFVNHSCRPNCRMVKWIVEGKPRMALFAGDNPITTGDELTYDYNFDPFSSKNVQECRCGSDNCRGFLGPKPKDQKVSKATIVKDAVKAGVKAGIRAGKRKLQEMIGGEEEDEDSSRDPKKRKMKLASGARRLAPSPDSKLSNEATKVTNHTTATPKLLDTQLKIKQRTTTTIKTYGKKQIKLSSRSSSFSLSQAEKSTADSKNDGLGSRAPNMRASQRGSLLDEVNESTITVVTDAGEEE